MGTCPPVAFDAEGAVWLACPDGKPGVTQRLLDLVIPAVARDGRREFSAHGHLCEEVLSVNTAADPFKTTNPFGARRPAAFKPLIPQ